MKRKILLLILSLSMVFGLCVGCSSAQEKELIGKWTYKYSENERGAKVYEPTTYRSTDEFKSGGVLESFLNIDGDKTTIYKYKIIDKDTLEYWEESNPQDKTVWKYEIKDNKLKVHQSNDIVIVYEK